MFIAIILMMGLLSCKKEKMFEQPTVELNGYSLEGLPGEYTNLIVDIVVTNNDDREATIKEAMYIVSIEGYIAEKETVEINKKITAGGSLELSLPLKLVTNDAVQILKKLDAGGELAYTVTGSFRVSDPVLKLFDWPIDIEGTASVKAGFEDFFQQPGIIINELTYTYQLKGFTSYTFDVEANSTVVNQDDREAVIDEVEYTVNVEGVQSETHLYSNVYDTDIQMAPGDSLQLILPVNMVLDPVEGATLVTALADDSADYTIEGTIHVISIEGASTDFFLPLYETGRVAISEISR